MLLPPPNNFLSCTQQVPIRTVQSMDNSPFPPLEVLVGIPEAVRCRPKVLLHSPHKLLPRLQLCLLHGRGCRPSSPSVDYNSPDHAVHHGVRGLLSLDAPKTFRPQLHTTASAVEVLFSRRHCTLVQSLLPPQEWQRSSARGVS